MIFINISIIYSHIISSAGSRRLKKKSVKVCKILHITKTICILFAYYLTQILYQDSREFSNHLLNTIMYLIDFLFQNQVFHFLVRGFKRYILRSISKSRTELNFIRLGSTQLQYIKLFLIFIALLRRFRDETTKSFDFLDSERLCVRSLQELHFFPCVRVSANFGKQ